MGDLSPPGVETESSQGSIDAIFQSAIRAHQAGHLDEAAEAYRQVLLSNKTHVDALHLLGMVRQQTGHWGEAEILIRQALALRQDPVIFMNLGLVLQEINRLDDAEASYLSAIELMPEFAEAHNNLGNVLKQTQRLAQAESAYQRAIELKPEFVDAYSNLGNVYCEMGRLPEAEGAYAQALKLNPEFVLGYFNLGNLYQETRRLVEAETAFRCAIELKPDFAAAYNNLGLIHKDTNRHLEAETLYRCACVLAPSFAEAHYNLGNLLQEMERWREAEDAYCRVLELNPSYLGALGNLGNVFKKSYRYQEAEEVYRKAIELNPDCAEAHYNLGNLLQLTQRSVEAEAVYRQTIALKPDSADAYFNLGKLLYESRRFAEAEDAYDQALALKADFADARWNRSLLLLIQGRYTEAWPDYEALYDPNRTAGIGEVPNLPFPKWQGESLVGKSLALLPEQGFGDYLQFVRYAPLLKERGLRYLTVVCDAPLVPLLETMAGVDVVITDEGKLPPHDYWSVPLGLPRHFSTTIESIPAALPYLHAQSKRMDKWQPRLPREGFKVGLAWQGNPLHRNDGNRSIADLSVLAPLWSVPGVVFVSLQREWKEEQAIQLSADQPMLPLGADIQDFADTAAIVAQLDLVISVDTAVAHLAGAMGKDCWTLLPVVGTDWRWFLDREDSPWYPGMRMFRQRTRGDWSETIKEVSAELRRRSS